MDNMESYVLNGSGFVIVVNGTQKVLYESRTELIITLLFMFVPFVITLVSQLLVIVTVARTHSLHEPHFAIVLSCCVIDVVCVTAACFATLRNLLQGPVDLEWTCTGKPLNYILAMLSLGNMLKAAVFAFERYIYFVHPFKYTRLFRPWSVALYILAPYVPPSIWVTVANFTTTKYFYASALTCLMSISPWQLFLQIMVIAFPPTFMCFFTIVSVLRLTRNVAPSTSTSTSGQVKQMRRAVRMLLLLAGTFWVTALPSYTASSIFQSSGSTWDDLDSRKNRTGAFGMRVAVTWMNVFFAPMVNPAIYLYSRKDLRVAMMKMLFRNYQVRPDSFDSGNSSTRTGVTTTTRNTNPEMITITGSIQQAPK